MPNARQLLANSLSRCQPGRESSTQSHDLFSGNPEVRRQSRLVAAFVLPVINLKALPTTGTSGPVPEAGAPVPEHRLWRSGPHSVQPALRLLRPGNTHRPGLARRARFIASDPGALQQHHRRQAPPIRSDRDGPLSELLWPYVILHRRVHNGKSASFGRGRYEVLQQQDTATQRATALKLS
jgi:hypothetical protein